LWRKHIGMVVDYTVGVAANDKAKQDKAVAELIGYTQDFGAFLQSANPNLPKSVVADLVSADPRLHPSQTLPSSSATARSAMAVSTRSS